MGKRDHYLPASLLGRFSPEKSGSTRDRRVWILRRQGANPYRTKPSEIGFVNNMYRVHSSSRPGPSNVDEVWEAYEHLLPSELDKLEIGQGDHIEAKPWVRTLVPFVVGLLVRGPDFDTRFVQRMDDQLIETLQEDGPHAIDDNTNLGRILEMQRLLPCLLAADWTVGHLSGELELITNDLGYALTIDPKRPDNPKGYTIPIDPRNFLMVTAREKRLVAFRTSSSEWRTPIRHITINNNVTDQLNAVIAGNAQQFIVGGTKEIVTRYASALNSSPAPATPDAAELGFPGSRARRQHEFDWHRLAAFLEHDPETAEINEQLEWDSLNKGWYPPVFLPTDSTSYHGSLVRKGSYVFLDLAELPHDGRTMYEYFIPEEGNVKAESATENKV